MSADEIEVFLVPCALIGLSHACRGQFLAPDSNEHGPPHSNIQFPIRVLIADQIASIVPNAMINGVDLTNDLRTLD